MHACEQAAKPVADQTAIENNISLNYGKALKNQLTNLTHIAIITCMNKGVLQKGIFLKCAFFVYQDLPGMADLPNVNQDEEIK